MSKVATTFKTIAVALTILSLVGCNSTKESADRAIETTPVYSDEVVREIENIIRTTKINNKDIVEEGFEFSLEDVNDLDSIEHTYYSQGAYYIQVDRLMYRFQITRDGKIGSYIKYKIEG